MKYVMIYFFLLLRKKSNKGFQQKNRYNQLKPFFLLLGSQKSICGHTNFFSNSLLFNFSLRDIFNLVCSGRWSSGQLTDMSSSIASLIPFK